MHSSWQDGRLYHRSSKTASEGLKTAKTGQGESCDSWSSHRREETFKRFSWRARQWAFRERLWSNTQKSIRDMNKRIKNAFRWIAGILVCIAGYAIMIWRPLYFPVSIFIGILACNKIMPQDWRSVYFLYVYRVAYSPI